MNTEDILPAHVSWREYADHCLTHDPMPWGKMSAWAVNSPGECHPDTMEAAGPIPALPTGRRLSGAGSRET
jgi:hypothetical protein